MCYRRQVVDKSIYQVLVIKLRIVTTKGKSANFPLGSAAREAARAPKQPSMYMKELGAAHLGTSAVPKDASPSCCEDTCDLSGAHGLRTTYSLQQAAPSAILAQSLNGRKPTRETSRIDTLKYRELEPALRM